MRTTITTLIILIAFANTAAFGVEKTKNKMAEPTTEQRQSMAASHEKMAVCLRSDKPMEDCRKEMMQSCQDMMGKDGCAMMMNHMGKMHAKGKGMMHDQEKDNSEKEKK
ncbi:MAG: hypothetical protein PHY93_09215 [Bacteriovorax sp.]|nr:hypothetical protein [Bacteriovorax sp.]